jgi:glycosyltransferase involved in cell wall biosynthesis
LLITSTSLPPFGGLEQVAWETAKRLVADYDVHILTTDEARVKISEGISIHSVPPKHPYTLWYSTFLKHSLNSTLASISPDILHFHQPLPWAYVFAKAKCTKVLSCHGLYFSPTSKRPRRSYPNRLLLPRAVRNADIVCAPSKWLADYIEEEYNVECTVLPNGVDTSIFAPLEGTKNRSNVILYVGRFIANKGLQEIFEAAKVLREYEFWLVGDERSGTVRAPSLPNIRLMGLIEHDDLNWYYNQASVCVFPSYLETFSIAGLEAMACGRAIVATKLGFSEYLENERDGLIVEPGRSDELIESIKYLMQNETARSRIERNAREKALKFDWNIIINRYRALYEKLQ